MIKCRALTAEADIDALAPAWRELQAKIGLCPFTDYDWVKMWWKSLACPSGCKLLVLACFDQDRLVGVLPFEIRVKRGVRILRLACHEAFYYRNLLIEEPRYAEALWKKLRQTKLYDVAVIKNLHDGTSDHDCLARFATRLLTSRIFYRHHGAVSRDTYLKALSSRGRRRIKQGREELEQNEALSWGVVTAEPVPTDLIDFLYYRKREWCDECQRSNFFDEHRTRDFYHDMVRLAAQRGQLALFWIRHHGRAVAVVITFHDKGTSYGHSMTFDRVVADLRPGIFLSTEAMIWAAEHGCAESNLMEGEEEFKQRYASTFRLVHEYAFVRTLSGLLYFLPYAVLKKIEGFCKRRGS